RPRCLPTGLSHPRNPRARAARSQGVRAPALGTKSTRNRRETAMRNMRHHRLFPTLPTVLPAAPPAPASPPRRAPSHREAPFIALDPAADNTDVYAFVSYDAANLARNADDRKVTFIMNVLPGQDPSDGPNYFNFDDEVLYAINIDNDADGKADDLVYEFRFKTANRPGPGGLTSPV